MPKETYLFFDTETSDLINFKARDSDSSQPWVCQLAARLTDELGNPINTFSVLIKSDGLPMSKEAEDVHHISIKKTDNFGFKKNTVLHMFLNLLIDADNLVAHNLSFDRRLLRILAYRICTDAVEDYDYALSRVNSICTMLSTTEFCKLPFPSGRRGYKWPKLEELYRILFNEELSGAHDALTDVDATIRCFFELKSRGIL